MWPEAGSADHAKRHDHREALIIGLESAEGALDGSQPEREAPRGLFRSVMAKFHARPSAQYRYEHYDPTS